MASLLSNTKILPLHVHVYVHSFSYPPPSFRSSPLILSPPFYRDASLLQSRISPLKASASEGDNLLNNPLISQGIKGIVEQQDYSYVQEDEDEDEEDSIEEEEEDKWIDWEDQILDDTVPLVACVRTILHSGKYENGARLRPEHEKTILEKLLPFHPQFEKKIGCGIDYITIGYHPNFKRSRCLFIVRQDGELVDFSYWKCIKGLIRKNYPLYADSFILRHFRQRSRNL